MVSKASLVTYNEAAAQLSALGFPQGPGWSARDPHIGQELSSGDLEGLLLLGPEQRLRYHGEAPEHTCPAAPCASQTAARCGHWSHATFPPPTRLFCKMITFQ